MISYQVASFELLCMNRELYPGKQDRKLKRVSTTRWMSHKSALDVVLNTYISIIETLGSIREESSDKRAASEINGVLLYSVHKIYIHVTYLYVEHT